MHTTFKKLGAFILALVMIFALSATAFAAGENTGSSDYDGNTGHPYAQQSNAEFSLQKDIVLFNVDNSAILDPNVVYTYQVSSVNVTDGDPTVTGYVLGDNTKPLTTAAVKDGVDGAVTIQGRKVNAITGTDGAGATVSGAVSAASNEWKTTLTFGGDNGTKLATLDEGTTVSDTTTAVTTGYIDVKVNADAIYAAGKGPGIYRYKISDVTTDANLKASGIARDANYVKDLYLDVYVKNNSHTPVDGYVVYGYVLFKTTNVDIDILFDSSVTTETVKVDGYTVKSEVALADQYHTYNVEVSKATTGDLADKRNNFPFQIDLANTSITSQDDFYYVITKDGIAQTEVHTNLAADGKKTIGSASATEADNLALQDGDKILITGLPVFPDTTAKYTTIDVTEYNNLFDVYTASAKDEAGAALKLDNNDSPAVTDAESVAIKYQKTASLHTVKDVDYVDSKDIVAITNNIETISPTGVVLRVAPYALMLGAGFLFILLAKRRKEEPEEA